MTPVSPARTGLSSGLPLPGILATRPLLSWLAIGALIGYLCFCWFVYMFTVEPLYYTPVPYSIYADSNAYFAAARGSVTASNQIGLGGSVIGPAIVAMIFRTSLGVAVFNCLLFALSIQLAAGVPGLRRRTFTILLIVNALTLPALMTLNKEILALAGVVCFGRYIYSRNRPVWLLVLMLVLSSMARWQQTAFILLYFALQSRAFPFRQRPKTGLAVLIVMISAAWALIAWRFTNVLAAYVALAAEIKSPTISRLNAIQGKGGFLIAVWPKMLMNISGHLLQPSYFLTQWVHEDFHELQNTVIGNLHSLVMLILLAAMIWQGKFRLRRPLVHFALIYLVMTAVSPLIQNRYEYPAYVLLAMEVSRKKDSLEPVIPMRSLPPLIPSYQEFQAAAERPAGAS